MLTVFQFESQQVRFVGTPNDPWWIASDICSVLEIQQADKAIKRLDDDEKRLGDRNFLESISNTGSINLSFSSNSSVWLINESGLYSLILTSRKPQAKRFKKWITSEVLPSLRKTGSYTIPKLEQPHHSTIDVVTGLTLIKQSLLNCNIKTELVEGLYLNGVARHCPAIAPEVNEAHKVLAATTPSELLLTPTAIGKRLGKSAIDVNKLLLNMGFQEKNPNKGKGDPAYIATEQGKPYSDNTLATGKVGDDSTYQHLKWRESILEVLNGGVPIAI